LLWGTRVVIPKPLRTPVLKALHEGHPGIVRMKALARSYVWWPSMDDEIAKWVSSCRPCQESRPAPPIATPTKWESANAPWSQLHIDLAGPFHGKTFLVVVDSFSKWIDVALLLTTTTRAVAQALTRLFVTHGLPDTIVSDNGPQFASTEFSQYSRLSRFLLSQHSTPCTVTNKSLAELLMGRRLRTVLDRLHPHYCPDTPIGSNSRVRSFMLQDQVFARNYAGDPLWVPGKVVAITGPRSYRVQLEDGRIWRRHLDQIRSRQSEHANADPGTPVTVQSPYPNPSCDLQSDQSSPAEPREWTVDRDRPTEVSAVPTSDATGLRDNDNLTIQPGGCDHSHTPDRAPVRSEGPAETVPDSQNSMPPCVSPELRRSGRSHKPLAYLKDYSLINANMLREMGHDIVVQSFEEINVVMPPLAHPLFRLGVITKECVVVQFYGVEFPSFLEKFKLSEEERKIEYPQFLQPIYIEHSLCIIFL
ncbi:uncharacterized protein K02A2.6-like, partial [Pseudonaja textilis]|uniref:uncharacterized protein K02A2.6-like n=1 Tax=Pseudonaja textilis TaxID=8673 RepID=UPI000EA9669B